MLGLLRICAAAAVHSSNRSGLISLVQEVEYALWQLGDAVLVWIRCHRCVLRLGNGQVLGSALGLCRKAWRRSLHAQGLLISSHRCTIAYSVSLSGTHRLIIM